MKIISKKEEDRIKELEKENAELKDLIRKEKRKNETEALIKYYELGLKINRLKELIREETFENQMKLPIYCMSHSMRNGIS